MTWFGDLDLAYKYSIVFGGLIALTMLAGACKVIYNHRRLKKHTKLEQLEAGKKEDQVELNVREKDEGDLFGIRAIEAGFYGGVHQSRPVSRAGSFTESTLRGTSTLLGGVNNSLKAQGYSMNSSVASLPLAHTVDRDSNNSEPQRRNAPPAIRLAPSEAQMGGRINHNVAVNMNLSVPPSPVLPRHMSNSPTFGGSDDGSSDGRASPASPSPLSGSFQASHYAPSAPQIPMPSGLSVTVHAPEESARSQAASFNDSPLPSRGPSPDTRLPDIPTQAARDQPPTHPSSTKLPSTIQSYAPAPPAPQIQLPARPSSPPQRLLPQTFQPTHAHSRDMSDASSVYDVNRASMQPETHYQPQQTPQQQYQTQNPTHSHEQTPYNNHNPYQNPIHHTRNLSLDSTSSSSFNFAYDYPSDSKRNSLSGASVALSVAPSVAPSVSSSTKDNRQSMFLGVGSNKTNEPRLSEFYDAYYRQSMMPTASGSAVSVGGEGEKRPKQLNLAQETIVEVDSPLPSPNPMQPLMSSSSAAAAGRPGYAL